MTISLAIVGGGWAGLAAAVRLAAANRKVVLFEAAHALGGRARRIEYRGTVLDNGLHLLIGAYHQTLAVMATVIPGELPLRNEALDLHFPGRFRLRAPALPAPWHLVSGLLGCQGLSWIDRLAAARFVTALRSMRYQLARDCSVARLLATHAQSERTCRYLWHPLCIAALNTRPEEASAQVFLNVLRDSFNGSHRNSRLLLPTSDLAALFPEPAGAWLRERGSQVRAGCAVRQIEREEDGYRIVHGAGEERYAQVICALPPYRVLDVLGTLLPPAVAAALRSMRHEPIYSIYLQYEPGVRLPQDMLGLDGELAQWAFDRGRLCGQDGLIAAVISASGPHQDLAHAELARRVAIELRQRFPLPDEPLWHKVVAERRATFACTPGLSRPDQISGIPGLYLAGDYTASPYPGTLEAAVRSGVRCADMILHECA